MSYVLRRGNEFLAYEQTQDGAFKLFWSTNRHDKQFKLVDEDLADGIASLAKGAGAEEE